MRTKNLNNYIIILTLLLFYPIPLYYSLDCLTKLA